MRINKFLAKAGIGSRRGVEKYITEGRVSVNGVIIKELSTKISSEDRVFFDGKEIRNHEEFVYYKLNKPVGFTTTLKDPYADRVIIDLIEDERRIYPIGRLDKDSCGLILLTNDGDFTYQLSHPKYHLSKTYKVRVEGRPKDSDIRKLEEGILLDGYKTKKTEIRLLSRDHKSSLYDVVLWEGRNRQIRKMFDSIHHPVVFLQRIKIGKITLGDLKEGQYRQLTKKELEFLRGQR